MQPGSGQPGREQIMLLEHPEHVSLHAGEDAGGEHGCRCPVLDIGVGAGDLVQRAACEASAGESGVEIGQAERQRGWRMRGRPMPFQPCDGVTQLIEGHRGAGGGANGVHGVVLILFCSTASVKPVSLGVKNALYLVILAAFSDLDAARFRRGVAARFR